jgi:hypothetical protein
VALEEVYQFTCLDANPADASGCQNQAIAAPSRISWPIHSRRSVWSLIPPRGDQPDLPVVTGADPRHTVAYDGRVIYVGVKTTMFCSRGCGDNEGAFAAGIHTTHDCILPSADRCKCDGSRGAAGCPACRLSPALRTRIRRRRRRCRRKIVSLRQPTSDELEGWRAGSLRSRRSQPELQGMPGHAGVQPQPATAGDFGSIRVTVYQCRRAHRRRAAVSAADRRRLHRCLDAASRYGKANGAPLISRTAAG